MKTAVLVAVLVIGCLSLSAGGMLFAQDAAAPAAPAAGTVMPEWLWGEVVSVDKAARTLTVKYLDYDTDIEKETVIYTDDATVFENIKSLDEIKAEDTVSIDFTVAQDKQLAKLISVERIEDETMFPPEEAEIAPEKVGSEPTAGGSAP